MEILQTAELLCFALQGNTSCPRIIFEMRERQWVRIEFNRKPIEFELGGKVKWPVECAVDETGKFKMNFYKETPGNWTEPVKLSQHKLKRLYPRKIKANSTTVAQRFDHPVNVSSLFWLPVKLIGIRKFWDPNICELTLKRRKKLFHYLYIGRYMLLSRRRGKGIINKSPYYSTIFFPYHNSTYPNRRIYDFQSMDSPIRILVSDYGNKVSVQNKLCTRTAVNSTLYLSTPRGGFEPSFIDGYNYIQVLAESIGIGAALPVIVWALQSNMRSIIQIYYFNDMDGDIIYKEELDEMARRESRIKLDYILRRPSTSEYHGPNTTINKAFMREYGVRWNPENKTFYFLAGHSKYVFLAFGFLTKQLGYPVKSIYTLMTK